jgi:hypothetical protein
VSAFHAMLEAAHHAVLTYHAMLNACCFNGGWDPALGSGFHLPVQLTGWHRVLPCQLDVRNGRCALASGGGFALQQQVNTLAMAGSNPAASCSRTMHGHRAQGTGA